MLGFGDWSVAVAFMAMIVSTAVCVVYGIVNWNRGDTAPEELDRQQQWATEEARMDEAEEA